MHNVEKNALDLLKQGNKKGLKEIFDLLYIPLCLYSQKFVGNMDVAEDIVQEVFISFWENKNYLNVKSNISAYLNQTVKNRSLNYISRNKLKTSEWLEEYENIYSEIPQEDNIQEEILKKVYQAINELPPGSRKIFKTIVIDGLSYKAAADFHSISINTVKSQLRRATKILSQKLDDLSFVILMELFFSILSK